MTRPEARPLVAVVTNVLTPYRLHFHRRIAREMSEIRLASLFTHDQPDQPWTTAATAEIGPVHFGHGDPVSIQGSRRHAIAEWRKGGRIIRWLADNNAAAVVVCGYNDPARLRIIRWCRAQRIPCLNMSDSNVMGDTASGPKRIVKQALVGWVVRSSDALLPCGTLGARYFQRYGAPPERIFLCPYEPDYDLVTTLGQESIEQTMNRFGLASDRHRLVVCSRLEPHKRIDLAVDAFIRIADRRPDWDLVIIGGGSQAGLLQSRIPSRLSDRVRWVGFLDDQAAIGAVYRASHILVHPSDWEPWAVVLNEAAAAGLAIVASSVVGAAEDLVRAGVNGWTFPAGDAAALTETLMRATEPETLARLRRNSHAVLADWRRRADPIAGLRAALRSVNVPKTPRSQLPPQVGHEEPPAAGRYSNAAPSQETADAELPRT